MNVDRELVRLVTKCGCCRYEEWPKDYHLDIREYRVLLPPRMRAGTINEAAKPVSRVCRVYRFNEIDPNGVVEFFEHRDVEG
jgi:hypothetical protein